MEHAETVGAVGVELRPASATLAFARRYAWVAGWWAVGRALVLGVALAVHAVDWPHGYLRHDLHRHVFGLLGAWDGRWYRMVASEGYLVVPGRQSDPAFFPLFPLLLRGVHALGLGYYGAGMLISNLALLGALASFYAFTRALFPESLARRATVYAAIFPFGYVFSMAYPESIVLAAIALAGLAALRNRWLLAGVCAAVAALARPEGLFVALPLLVIAWQRRRTLSPVSRGVALGAVLAPAAALASYPLYLRQILHDPMAWSRAQAAWGRHFSPLGFVRALSQLPAQFTHDSWISRDVVALLVYLALLAVAARVGAPWPWLVGGLAIVALPVFSGSFDSISRFGLLAPPVFWGLAALGGSRRADLSIRTLSLGLLAAGTVTLPFIFP